MSQYAIDRPTDLKDRLENIAIVGATGSVGKYIVEHLLKQGKHTITAITRASSTSKIPDGVHTANVDYDDKSSLINALNGQDALIITMATTAPSDTQKKLIAAAAKAGVAWIMTNEYCPDFTSYPEMGADTMLGPGVLAIRKYIEELGVSSWVGLHSGFWYEFSLAGSPDRFGFDLASKKVTFFDNGETKVNTSTWAQSGRAVAAFFALPCLPDDSNDHSPTLSQWKNKPLYMDSFCLSQKDMFEALLRATGDKESDWTIEYEPSTERYIKSRELLDGGDFTAFSRVLYSRVFYKDGSGDYGKRGVLANEALGLPKEDLDESTKHAVEMTKTGELGYHQADYTKK